MPADLSGTWTLLSSDNFEGYMLALGKAEGRRRRREARRGSRDQAKAAGPGL